MAVVKVVDEANLSVVADVLTFGAWGIDQVLELLHAAEGCEAVGRLYQVRSGGYILSVFVNEEDVTVIGIGR